MLKSKFSDVSLVELQFISSKSSCDYFSRNFITLKNNIIKFADIFILLKKLIKLQLYILKIKPDRNKPKNIYILIIYYRT